MKRFHVHVAVDDLARSIKFYSTLFAVEPTVAKPDYAKWMLEDPRVNFAISKRGGSHAGIEHLGIQVDNEDELSEVYGRLAKADRPVVEEKDVTCCYHKSDKRWIDDPQGVSWETFFSHGEATTYGGCESHLTPEAEANTAPAPVPLIAAAETGCCPAAKPAAPQAAACCGPKA